jgi:uncharacterized membrane protein
MNTPNIPPVGETPEPGTIDLEHLWQFAGQGLRSSDFNTAMVHFYRGEVTRSNTWRMRLDATTNWAVVTTGAALSFAFSGVENTPLVILVDTMLVVLFLFIEARRYRYYELWAMRVRIMENNFFCALLSPPFLPHSDWADRLTDSLKNPRFPITLLEALGRRYRRNYAPIFAILAFSWALKVWVHPTAGPSLAEFLERSAVGPIPGWVMLLIGVLFNGAFVALGLYTAEMRASTGEVFEQGDDGLFASLYHRVRRATWEALDVDLGTLLPNLRFDSSNHLAYIITDQIVPVSRALMKELGRGVTLLQGKGMYTGEEHGVMMCVVNAKQKKRVRDIVHKEDAKAFVIMTVAEDVRGFGFRPLEA